MNDDDVLDELDSNELIEACKSKDAEIDRLNSIIRGKTFDSECAACAEPVCYCLVLQNHSKDRVILAMAKRLKDGIGLALTNPFYGKSTEEIIDHFTREQEATDE